MIRVCLGCGHSFDTGQLDPNEVSSGKTFCPICKASVDIIKAHRLQHPPDSKKRWVLGEVVFER